MDGYSAMLRKSRLLSDEKTGVRIGIEWFDLNPPGKSLEAGWGVVGWGGGRQLVLLLQNKLNSPAKKEKRQKLGMQLGSWDKQNTMEANYSNYDRSQIKLIFKAPNKPQSFGFCFVLFCVLLLSFQGRRGRKGEKVVRQWALLVRTGKETVAPFLRDGVGKKKKKKKKQKRKRIKTIASIIFFPYLYSTSFI